MQKTLTQALTEAHDRIEQLVTTNGELNAQLLVAQEKVADVEPRIALLEQQRADLEKICDKVRDRMKRKELDEERAILNRKALVGAQPLRDWRR